MVDGDVTTWRRASANKQASSKEWVHTRRATHLNQSERDDKRFTAGPIPLRYTSKRVCGSAGETHRTEGAGPPEHLLEPSSIQEKLQEIGTWIRDVGSDSL